MANVEALAKFVRERRDELGLSQNEVRRLCGKSTAPLEAGVLANAPQLDSIEAWARALRVDPMEMCAIAFGRKPQRESVSGATDEALSDLTPREVKDLLGLAAAIRREAAAGEYVPTDGAEIGDVIAIAIACRLQGLGREHAHAGTQG